MILAEELRPRRLVLVVDDQEINRDILETILEDEYEVLFAEDGLQAMEAIEANIEHLSLVMLDLVMPVMNGFEVLERMHADARMRLIPIIVLTSEKNAELEALQLGAADFITKPFDLQEVILARVERMIELSEGRRLISATEFDPLTQLYTRGFFAEYAEFITRYHPSWHMDAMALNIDRFHSINNSNGRDFGDKVLRTLGDEIRAFLKGTQGIAGRLDADSFQIFCQHQEDYEAILERFQQRVNGLSDRTSIRLRMGVSPWAPGLPLSTMLDRANTACNMVRGNYQEHLVVYDESIYAREMYHQRLLDGLQAAIDERQFKVYFQPKYDIQQTPPRLKSAEALVRWQHPELGLISPGDFIPLFERNGFIRIVDHYVWRETARYIRTWKEEHGISLPVSVNVSRAEIFDSGLEQNLMQLVESNGLTMGELMLEVTESAYTDNANQLIDAIHQLQTRGFRIEMDDFGSGYSSLNMLSSLPIDVLKMDMGFIRNVETDAKSFRMVELVLDIAKYLGVPVVAEGVESENQMALLRNARCDLVQGFYFSRPLPAEEFEKLLLREHNRERG